MCLVILLLTGILPTTVLGQIQSPDLDDWSEKVYQFEGKSTRYFDLIGETLKRIEGDLQKE